MNDGARANTPSVTRSTKRSQHRDHPHPPRRLRLVRVALQRRRTPMTPLHAAGLAKRFRSQARTARLAGNYTHAAALYRMAATTQARAVADDFGAAA